MIIKYNSIHRTAIVRESKGITLQPYVVDFYYDGYPDFEWKRGSHGMSCDLCDTLEQAKRKANNYIKKDLLYK